MGPLTLSCAPSTLFCFVRPCFLASSTMNASLACSEGGFFKGVLTFPQDYPNNPPEFRFTSEMWHPNGMLHSLRQFLACFASRLKPVTLCPLLQCTQTAECAFLYCTRLETTRMVMNKRPSVGYQSTLCAAPQLCCVFHSGHAVLVCLVVIVFCCAQDSACQHLCGSVGMQLCC